MANNILLASGVIWFEDNEIHLDAPLYARMRGISVDDATAELREMITELLPGVRLHEVD